MGCFKRTCCIPPRFTLFYAFRLDLNSPWEEKGATTLGLMTPVLMAFGTMKPSIVGKILTLSRFFLVLCLMPSALIVMLSLLMLSVNMQCAVMLITAMQSAVVQSVIVLCVIMLRVLMPSFINLGLAMLSVIMPSVILLNVIMLNMVIKNDVI
jgi:hypothetical protein